MRTELWLHEELLLLSMDPQQGSLPWQGGTGRALMGAALTDLLISGRVRLESKGRSRVVVVKSSSQLGDPLLDELLERIRSARKPPTIETLLQTFAGRPGLDHRIAERLWYRGYVRREVKSVALVFSRRVYPITRMDVRERIVARLRAALQNPREPEPRDRALLALLKHMGRLPAVLDAATRRQLRARINQVLKLKTVAGPGSEQLAVIQAALARS